MINEKRAVTINDKKKAKSTCVLFGGFAAFFLLGTVLTGIFTPRANKVTGINGDDTDSIRTFTSFNSGEEFVAANSATLQRFSMENNKVLESIPYEQEIRGMLAANTEYYNANFEDVTLHYESINSDDGYLLVFDSDGDIFRYEFNDNHLILDNDYWLTERTYIKEKLYKAKYKISALDVSDDELYVLYTNDSSFVINVYDVNHLNNGVLRSKTLISVDAPNKDEKVEYGKNVYLINKVTTKRHVYDFAIEGEYVSLLTGQGLTRWNKNLLDYDDGSNQISYLNNANKFVDQALKDQLISDEAKKSELGITTEDVNNASDFATKQMYQLAYGDSAYVTKLKLAAKDFKSSNSWVKEYDPVKDIFVIDSNYYDDKYNLDVIVGSSQTMGGSAYSTKDKVAYYLDLKSNALYSYPIEKINSLSISDNKTLLDLSTKTGVTYKGVSFYDIKGNVSYDRVTNNIHVYFYSSQKVSIVDINGKEPVEKIRFALEYDVRSFISNKEGTRIAGLYQIEKRTIKNVASFPLNVIVVNPSTYQYRTFFVILFVALIVLFAVSIIVLLISLKAYKRTLTMLKLKVIQRDFKRNKWTYVALIPFIAALIMFCYIEAVGSISFSFFSYTQQKPSYIWNTFGNYIEIFNDSKFWLMFGNTAFFLIFDLFLGIVPPIIFAFFLSIIKNHKLSGVLRALMFIPAVVPGIATLLIWKVGIFGDTGVLNQLILFFKTGTTVAKPGYQPINFLHDETLSRWSLLLMGFPYVGGYLIFYGGIMNIPKEYDEACQLEGLGVIKRFFQIDLPLIKPQIKYIFVMGILNSVQNYERTYMLGSNGTTTLVESMYRQMKDVGNPNYGLASAYATIIFLLLLFPVLWNFSKTKKDTMGDI